MISKYYLCLVPNEHGLYEVHKDHCPRLCRGMEALYLGEYEDCHGAVEKARAISDMVIGCSWFAFECHDTF